MTKYASLAELRKAMAGGEAKLPPDFAEIMRPANMLQPEGAPPPSTLEALFSQIWGLAGGGVLLREYRFHPTAGWRFDFALPAIRVAIEIEGGLHGGRHVRPKGFIEDATKYNAATLAGWRLLRLTTAHLSLGYIEPLVSWTKGLENELCAVSDRGNEDSGDGA